MEITFLGTSCMVPTKDRNHPSILFHHHNEYILFDCGEGTQRQLKITGISIMKINKIFISHWHGDHVLGIPGLLQTIGAGGYEGTLKIYGPKGTKERFKYMYETFIFENNLDIEINEIEEGILYEGERLVISAYKLDHKIDSYGFKVNEKDRIRLKTSKINELKIPGGPLLGQLQKGEDIEFEGKTIKCNEVTYIVKGKIFGLIADTLFCPNTHMIAKDCDLLVSESSFDHSHEDRALEYKHMTSQQAAQVASMNNAKKLILFHFSQRYKSTDTLLNDAKNVFENTTIAHDFMKIKI